MQITPLHRSLSIAPMLDCTDRHCRYLHRLLHPHALLYTEMITTAALLHGRHEQLLAYNPEEHPLVLQLGGSNPEDLARCASMGEEAGYDEINLNIGCPSDRVQSGRFGACLMLEPATVADCVASMIQAVRIPVSVKCRLGVDEQDTEESLDRFVEKIADAGCQHLVIHARKAWLKGLSPKDNRNVPPLDYDRVYRLKQEYPQLHITLNGGIKSASQTWQHLHSVDGIMLGREAYQNPWLLAELSGQQMQTSRQQIATTYADYVRKELSSGTPVTHLCKPVLGLYRGEKGGKLWRKMLAESAQKSGNSMNFSDILSLLPDKLSR